MRYGVRGMRDRVAEGLGRRYEVAPPHQYMLNTRATGSRSVSTVRRPGTVAAAGCIVTPSVSCRGTPHRAAAAVKTSRTVVPAACWGWKWVEVGGSGWTLWRCVQGGNERAPCGRGIGTPPRGAALRRRAWP